MKFKGMRYFCLVVGCLVLLTPSCTCADAPITPTVPVTPTEYIPSPELVKFAAEQIMLDADQGSGISLEGSVIAHVVGCRRLAEDRYLALQAWRYEEGQLVGIGIDVFMRALYRNDPELPVRTIAFTVKPLGSDQVELDIVHRYRISGGYAEIWRFEKQGEEWGILDKETYMYMD